MIDTEWLKLLLSHHTHSLQKTLGSSFPQVPEWWAAKELLLAKLGSAPLCSAKTVDALVVYAVQKEKWPLLPVKWGILIWIPPWLLWPFHNDYLLHPQTFSGSTLQLQLCSLTHCWFLVEPGVKGKLLPLPGGKAQLCCLRTALRSPRNELWS